MKIERVFKLLLEHIYHFAIEETKEQRDTKSLQGRARGGHNFVQVFPLAARFRPERCQHVVKSKQWYEYKCGAYCFPVYVCVVSQVCGGGEELEKYLWAVLSNELTCKCV